MGTDDGLALESLLSEEDLRFLKDLAAERRVTPQELAKQGIQSLIVRKTRPKLMPVSGEIRQFKLR